MFESWIWPSFPNFQFVWIWHTSLGTCLPKTHTGLGLSVLQWETSKGNSNAAESSTEDSVGGALPSESMLKDNLACCCGVLRCCRCLSVWKWGFPNLWSLKITWNFLQEWGVIPNILVSLQFEWLLLWIISSSLPNYSLQFQLDSYLLSAFKYSI